MSGAVQVRTFNSRIARRWFGFILLISVVPLLVSASIAYNNASQRLISKATLDLRQQAKYLGQTTLEKLREIEQAVQGVLTGQRNAEDLVGEQLLEIPYVHGTPMPRNLSDRVREVHQELIDEISSGSGPTLRVIANDSSMPVVLLATSRDEVGVTVRVNPARLTLQPVMLPTGIQLCMSAGDVEIQCLSESDLGFTETTEIPLQASWELFLDSTFNSENWKFSVRAEKAVALEALESFQRSFFLGLAIVGFAIIFAGVRLVRTMIRPLENLQTLTRRLAQGDLGARANIETNDEMSDLGDAFNDMAEKIGQQVVLFESLAEIDRKMLEGSDLEVVCESMLGNLSLALPGSLNAIVVSSKYVGGHAAIYAPDSTGSMVAHRAGSTLADILAATGDYGCVDGNTPAGRQLLHCNADFLGRDCYVVPVHIQGDLRAIVVAGSARGHEYSQAAAGRVSDLANRIAIALNAIDRDSELYQRAHYDEVSGLPNRQLLFDRLGQEILIAGRRGESGALFFLDLDHFKQVNDLAGHATGDKLLRAVGQRLINIALPTDTVARIGGDEFVILAPGLISVEDVSRFAASVVRVLQDQFVIDGSGFFVGASIGIAIYPDDGSDAESILKNADSAMYAAKSEGRGRFSFYGAELNERTEKRARIEQELRLALSSGRDFEVHYQPKICFKTSRVCGAEALIRWKHPELGFIAPSDFIEIAESSGLIGRLGLWVLRRAARDIRRWRTEMPDTAPGSISINVSQRQLSQPGFVDEAIAVFAEYELDTRTIDLEVTETALGDDAGMALKNLRKLRDAGFSISIDDFGTGYSSLAQLVHTPFDFLKIDRSFVNAWQPGGQGEMIIRTIIDLAHGLGKKVVAEGVERMEEYMFLDSLGCEVSQGYLHSKAIPLADAMAYCDVVNSDQAAMAG